jgi:aspartyl protease family protein
MATGFMLRHCMAVALALAALPALAVDVQLVGTFGDKAAVLSIDGAAPKTVRVGQRQGGVAVLAVDGDSATVEIDGRRRVIRRGQHFRSEPAKTRQSVVLTLMPHSSGGQPRRVCLS